MTRSYSSPLAEWIVESKNLHPGGLHRRGAQLHGAEQREARCADRQPESIYNRDTDARSNLYRAFVYAVSDSAWGVQLVFDNKVILGTRARKTRTRSFNAFSSIDYPETAVFRDTRLVTFLHRPTDQPPVRFL